jgi:hypothetical protein
VEDLLRQQPLVTVVWQLSSSGSSRVIAGLFLFIISTTKVAIFDSFFLVTVPRVFLFFSVTKVVAQAIEEPT